MGKDYKPAFFLHCANCHLNVKNTPAHMSNEDFSNKGRGTKSIACEYTSTS